MTTAITKVTSHISPNEQLIFERSQTGRIGYRLPALDVDEVELNIPAEFRRDDDLEGMPEVSEVDVIRHFIRMSTWNYSIDLGMYPLGSCTMKYNSRLNERVARIAGFANLHPLTNEEDAQGALHVIYELQQHLAEITGLPGISLQPAAGAHGDVPGLILTNPNTLGLFERNIKQICDIVHEAGGLVYMDGANMNALVGVARPGDMGVDVIHLNLHKTFSTPHGGGGPGSGPCCCTKELEPYLPVPRIVKSSDSTYRLDYDQPKSIGRVKAFFGNYGMMLRALSYTLTHGNDGLREATEAAVINARYVAAGLIEDYDKPFAGAPMHEVVFTDKRQSRKGVHTLDIAKRLIDYGFHPMTIYFPLIVQGAMLIEPTESVGRQELDQFIAAMKSIASEAVENPELVLNAPHETRIGRLDEASAARKPVLRWKPQE